MKNWNIDDFEIFPLMAKCSAASCLGGRTLRPLCSCCGGSRGIRKAKAKLHNHHIDNSTRYSVWTSPREGWKPKRKWNKRETIRNMS